jgi:hypothetical protein
VSDHIHKKNKTNKNLSGLRLSISFQNQIYMSTAQVVLILVELRACACWAGVLPLKHAPSHFCFKYFLIGSQFYAQVNLDPPLYVMGMKGMHHHTQLFNQLRWDLTNFCQGWPLTITTLISNS